MQKKEFSVRRIRILSAVNYNLLCTRVVIPLQGDNSHLIKKQMSLYNMTFITMQCDHQLPKGGKFLKIRNILVKSKRRNK